MSWFDSYEPEYSFAEEIPDFFKVPPSVDYQFSEELQFPEMQEPRQSPAPDFSPQELPPQEDFEFPTAIQSGDFQDQSFEFPEAEKLSDSPELFVDALFRESNATDGFPGIESANIESEVFRPDFASLENSKPNFEPPQPTDTKSKAPQRLQVEGSLRIINETTAVLENVSGEFSIPE